MYAGHWVIKAWGENVALPKPKSAQTDGKTLWMFLVLGIEVLPFQAADQYIGRTERTRTFIFILYFTLLSMAVSRSIFCIRRGRSLFRGCMQTQPGIRGTASQHRNITTNQHIPAHFEPFWANDGGLKNIFKTTLNLHTFCFSHTFFFWDHHKSTENHASVSKMLYLWSTNHNQKMLSDLGWLTGISWG